MAAAINESLFKKLEEFTTRPVFQRGCSPLKNGTEIRIWLAETGPIVLTRKDGKAILVTADCERPDMTLWVPEEAVNTLVGQSTEDVGEIGVEILKLMANPEPAYKITVKLHIGPFEFLTRGYLGILPLGGSTVMKFLASKGLTGIGKIRDAISKLRG